MVVPQAGEGGEDCLERAGAVVESDVAVWADGDDIKVAIIVVVDQSRVAGRGSVRV